MDKISPNGIESQPAANPYAAIVEGNLRNNSVEAWVGPLIEAEHVKVKLGTEEFVGAVILQQAKPTSGRKRYKAL